MFEAIEQERAVAQIEPLATAERLQAVVEPELSLVPRAKPAERALRLYREAQLASVEHLDALQAAIGDARALAEAVVEGGALYGVGVHDLAKRLSEDLLWRGKSLEAFRQRQASGRSLEAAS